MRFNIRVYAQCMYENLLVSPRISLVCLLDRPVCFAALQREVVLRLMGPVGIQ